MLVLSMEDGAKLKKLMQAGTVKATTFARGDEVTVGGITFDVLATHTVLPFELSASETTDLQRVTKTFGDHE